MQRSEFQLNERIPYQAERTPLIHKIPTRTGVLLTQSKFVVTGSLTIAGGTANGTSLGENPGNLFLQTVQIQGSQLPANYPGGVLMRVGPRSFFRGKIFDHPEHRYVADPNSGISGIAGGAGTYTLSLDYTKFWALPWMARPLDTALDTSMFGSLQATITNGARDLQYSGNDRTFTYSGVRWDVSHKFQRFDGNGVGPLVVVYDNEYVVNINGANTRLQVNNLLPADGSCIDLLLMAETTNQVLSDAIVNSVTVLSGTEQFYFANANDTLRADMEDDIGDSSTTTTPRTGLYRVKVALDGLLLNSKNNVAMIIDQLNPGTDRLLIRYRRCVDIPATKKQGGPNKIATAA